MRRLLILSLMTALPTARAAMQTFDMKSLDRFEPLATETVNVTLDANMLRMAGKFLSKDDPDSAKVRKIVAGLKGIYVRSYSFKDEHAYKPEDLNWLRDRMKTPGWSRIVGVKNNKDGENAEVYVHTEGDSKVGGLTLFTTGPKELTVVQILGEIDLDDLNSLSGVGVPDLGISKTGQKKSK